MKEYIGKQNLFDYDKINVTTLNLTLYRTTSGIVNDY